MNGNNPFYNNQPVMPQYPQFSRGFRGQPPNYNQFIPSTNKQFVRSLEEALSLPADFNSQNVYFDINDDIMYDICTNGRGEKSWSILDISLRQSSGINAATGMAVSNPTEERMKQMEEYMKKLDTKLEAVLNGQQNVVRSGASHEGDYVTGSTDTGGYHTHTVSASGTVNITAHTHTLSGNTGNTGGNAEYKPKYYAVIAWQRTA